MKDIKAVGAVPGLLTELYGFAADNALVLGLAQKFAHYFTLAFIYFVLAVAVPLIAGLISVWMLVMLTMPIGTAREVVSSILHWRSIQHIAINYIWSPHVRA